MASDHIFDAATSRAYPALCASNPLLSLAEDKKPIYVGMKRVTGPNWKDHWTTYRSIFVFQTENTLIILVNGTLQ